MTLRDIAVAFGFEVDKSSVSGAERTINGLKNFATKALGAIGIGFSISGLSNLAQSAADLEALDSQFTQVFGDMEEQASQSLEKVADDAGALTNRMKSSFTQLAAFTKTTGASEAEALEVARRGMIAAGDSAAFYDRSLEDVTESLRSFLKGNYEQDAALGLSCTETTRNAAANKLYGKSFMELSEYQKQLTLLQMVEDANAASGALGQASRESETWTNWLGNLKQAVKDLKAATGSSFLTPAINVLKTLTTLVQKATDGVNKLTEENGFLTRATERYHALVKKVQPAVDWLTQAIKKGFSGAKSAIGKVTDTLGGTENALKIVSLTAGALFTVLNWGKIAKGATMFLNVLKSISKIFSFASLKVYALVAVIVALALVVEDFINFLVGNDSVIGSFFDEAGIGAENARKAIKEAWDKAMAFLSETWEKIKTRAGEIFESAKNTIAEHTESIRTSLSEIWGGIETIVTTIWENLKSVGETVFGGLFDFIGGLDFETMFENIVTAVDKVLQVFGAIGNWISEHQGLMETLVIILGSIAAAFGIVKVAITAYNVIVGICTAVSGGLAAASAALGAAIAFITSPIGIVIAAIAAVIAIGVLLYKNWDTIREYASKIWESIVGFFTSAWEKIVSAVQSGVQKVKDFFGGIISFVKENWQGLLLLLVNPFAGAFKLLYDNCSGFRDFIDNLCQKIVDFFSSAWSGIQNAFASVGEFFSNIFAKAWSGICSAFSGVKDFFSGIWESIVGIFATIGDTIGGAIQNAVGTAVNKVLSTAVGIINGFIGAINTAISVINAIPGVEIGKLEELEVPQLAEGGIATKATGAVIGEGSEPEAVLPLSKLGAMISGYIKVAKESDTWKAISTVVTGITDKVASGIAKLEALMAKQKPQSQRDELRNEDKDSTADNSDDDKPKPLNLGNVIGQYVQNLLANDEVKDVAGKVVNALSVFGNSVDALNKAATASPVTALHNTTNNSSSNIVQNNEFNNSFYGGEPETQRNVSKGVRKSADDATTQMARALAYARG